jgi:DNA-binding winged helix-turn-helix (wHTH) protein
MLRIDFGSFAFDAPKCLLEHNGRGVHLTRKAFLLFEMLVERRPAVVTKQQILDHLWPDCFVSEGSVATLVSEIRAALGREGEACIRTAHGLGYAFVARTQERPDQPARTPVAGAPRISLIEKGPPPRALDLADGETIIGRGVTCDLRLGSGAVSRSHARIQLAAGVASLVDLGSRNGTYLRGVRVPDAGPVVLVSGDEIRVGSVELIFRIEAPVEGKTDTLP